MSTADNAYATFGRSVAQAPADARVAFIRKTYTHLAAAVYAFAALEWALFQIVPAATMEKLVFTMLSGWNMLFLFGGFMVVSMIADRWARSDVSVGKQYAGLSLFVVAEAVIFLPILYIAQYYTNGIEMLGGANVIGTAAVITLVMFGGLTAAVFVTGKDFSFLRTALMMGSFAAIGLMLCGWLFGFSLGMLFSAGMIVLACGYILYDTSNVMHHYRTDQHVAAALKLFASIALMFWYVLQLLMSLSGRD